MVPIFLNNALKFMSSGEVKMVWPSLIYRQVLKEYKTFTKGSEYSPLTDLQPQNMFFVESAINTAHFRRLALGI